MAARGRPEIFYVYAVKDGESIVYIGKGTGRRLKVSARKHGGTAEILQRFASEDKAFAYERKMIAAHSPTNNRCAGGNGGRAQPRKPKRIPAWWRKQIAEIERVGSRVYSARFLVDRMDERNCEQWGVSKVDLFRLREVAYGCGA